MPTLARSAVLPVACLLLRATAEAQSPAAPGARASLPATEAGLEDARWVPAIHGAVPEGAVAHGRERDGRPQYICRALVDGVVRLGRVSPGSAGCVLVADGRAAVRGSYHVFTEVPVPGSAENKPSRWGRSESVLELINRRRAESRVPKKRLDE